MRKMYRFIVAMIALIGALVMGKQHDYIATALMILLAIVFLVRCNSDGTTKA